jgi:hypothetical protein
MKATELLFRFGLVALFGGGAAQVVPISPLHAQQGVQSLKPVNCAPSSAADATVRIRPERAQAVSLEEGLGIPRVRHWLDFPAASVAHETNLRFRVFRAGHLMVELSGEDGPVTFRSGTEPTLTLDVELCETGAQTYLLDIGSAGIRSISPDSILGSQMYFRIPGPGLYLLAQP